MKKILFYIARNKFMGLFVGFALTYIPFLVPVKKIMQNKNAVSFLHPSPAYSEHILIIPRKIARTVFYLTANDFLEVVNMAVKIRQRNNADYSLLINGGSRQDVMQAHFHLFTDNIAIKKGLKKDDGITFTLNDTSIWETVTNNMENMLNKKGLSKECFSILIQFECSVEPTIYLI